MPVITANGIPVPAAHFLAGKARPGEFCGMLHSVQAIELLTGAVTITLLSLNLRDRLHMTDRSRRRWT